MGLMKKGSIAVAFVAATICFGPAAFAQQAATASAKATQQKDQRFTDEELKTFVNVNTKITEIQKEGREAVVAAIEEQNLTVDRFNELAKAHRDKKLEEVAENPEEISSFSSAAQAAVKVQPETKEKIKAAVADAGLTMEEYNKILKAYESDEDVQMHVRRIVHAE